MSTLILCVLSVLALEINAPAPEAAKSMVDLVISAGTGQSASLRAAVEPGLAHAGVTLRMAETSSISTAETLAPVVARPGLLARAWVDTQNRDRVDIYLAPANSDRVVMRGVPVSGATDAVVWAQISEIIITAVESIKAGVAVGRPRSEVAAQLALAPSPNPRLQEFGVFVQAQTWAGAAPLVWGLGLSFLSARRSGNAWSAAVWATGAWHAPFDVAGGPASLYLASGSANLLALARHEIGPRTMIGFGAGGGVEFRSARPQVGSGAPELTMPSEYKDFVLLLRLAVRLDVELSRHTTAFVAAVADVPALQDRYTVDTAGVAATVFAPWKIRPGVLAGVNLF